MAERESHREEYLEFFCEAMRELRFIPGITDKAAAKEWNLAHSYVAGIARAASKRVRAELVEDSDLILSQIGASLQWVIRTAIAHQDRHAVLKACDIYARVAGLMGPVKVQVQDDLAALSPEQLAARKAELIARATARPALPGEVEITIIPDKPKE